MSFKHKKKKTCLIPFLGFAVGIVWSTATKQRITCHSAKSDACKDTSMIPLLSYFF